MSREGLAPTVEITPNRHAMRPSLLPLLAVLAASGCDRSAAPSAAIPDPRAATSTVAAESGSLDPSADAAPTEGLGDPPRLSDADLATLESGLKCTPGSPPKVPGPCNVLVAMENCSEWAGVASSSDGRWIGHGWRATGATVVNEVTILRSRAVPQKEVKPWQLAVKIAVGAIGKDAGPAFAQADAAIHAYAHHAAPPAGNAAVDFVKQKSDWVDDAPVAKTMGAMIETFSDRPAYLCQGPGQQMEVVQQASADIGVTSDGLYAELSPVTP